MDQAHQTANHAGRPSKMAGSAATITTWEDDPGSGSPPVSCPAPQPEAAPLAFAFPKPGFAPGKYGTGTAEFRYWVAVEALRRGASFWAAHSGPAAWQPGPKLAVLLDEGMDLNAFYDRQALNFFHGPGAKAGTMVFSGESGDVLCHEMGHAILDAIKPQLWGAASLEAAAFHESFGDMSAILSALQVPSLRKEVLEDTGGNLAQNSRLSRLAEQLGSAIRARSPDAVDPNCLRNAANSFIYQDPIRLPAQAPAAHLSSEPHSFSRVFTGAFLEALAGMTSARAGTPGQVTEADLLAASGDMADILMAGVKRAAVVSNFYAQVAASMVTAGASRHPAYSGVLRAAFVRRAILSLHSAADVQALHASAAAAMAPAPAPDGHEPLETLALPAAHYGLDQPLLVEAPSQHRGTAPHSFAFTDDRSLEPASSATAARSFVDDLFRQGRVDYAGQGRPEARLEHGHRRRSHKLVADGGVIRLERCLFDCGLNHL